jgi:hypothetical protein
VDEVGDLRREKATLASQHCDENLVVLCDLVHGSRQLVVVLTIKRVELLGHIKRDDGDFAPVFDEDAFF